VRVLTIGNLYPPHHFGGYEQIWQSAVEYLRSRGHEVHVLATDFRHPEVEDGNEPDIHRQLDWYWRNHDFATFSLGDRIRLERRNHGLLEAALRQIDPDVVSFWSMGGMSHSLIEDVRRRRLPAVFFVFDQWLDYGRFTDQWLRLFYGPRRGHLAPIAERATGIAAQVQYDAAGRYVFGSEFLLRRARALPDKLSDTAVETAGINPSFLEQNGHRSKWQWRVLHVGRLHPDKGIHDAVEAMTRLPREANLTFAGSWDPREESQLAQHIRGLGLEDRVTMLGQLPGDQIATLYRDHDVLLFPVVWEEPWGLVPLEAMASGCPVIGTGRGGSGEYMRSGENCMLVPAENPDALASAVRLLARDSKLRARIRDGGRETAARFTQPIYNARVESHLLEVATEARTR
jgi:glycosyltransferase involved in cell wall biosynthesis